MGIHFIQFLFSAIIFLSLIIDSLFAGENDINLYTDKERAAIVKLRPLVKDVLVHDYQQKDGYLLRFLRASDLNLDEAVKKLKRNLQYRKEKNLDNILSFNSKPHQKYLPYRLEGFDRAGRPIVEVMFGKWQIRKYVVAGKIDDLLTHYRRLYETTIEKIRQTAELTGRDIDQLYCIGDANGLTAREQLCLGCIPVMLDVARTFDAFVDVFVKNITLVNVPRIFQPVLSTIKTLLSIDSLNALNAYDNDKSVWVQALLRDISPDQLPLRLGGTNTNFK